MSIFKRNKDKKKAAKRPGSEGFLKAAGNIRACGNTSYCIKDLPDSDEQRMKRLADAEAEEA